MNLDRRLQYAILCELRNAYPNEAPVHRLFCFEDSQHFFGNLIYLRGHGLIEGEILPGMIDLETMNVMLQEMITPTGLDFLENDGGLSAILGGDIVGFDNHDLQQLLAAIDRLQASQEAKEEFKQTLSSLPAEGLKNIYSLLLIQGLDNLSSVLDLMQNRENA